jgi:hypothetical protein
MQDIEKEEKFCSKSSEIIVLFQIKRSSRRKHRIICCEYANPSKAKCHFCRIVSKATLLSRTPEGVRFVADFSTSYSGHILPDRIWNCHKLLHPHWPLGISLTHSFKPSICCSRSAAPRFPSWVLRPESWTRSTRHAASRWWLCFVWSWLYCCFWWWWWRALGYWSIRALSASFSTWDRSEQLLPRNFRAT